MTAMLVAAVAPLGAQASAAAAAPNGGRQPRVIVAILPSEVSPAELAGVPGMALGLMSAGIGVVPPAQTYLDVSQGNRLNPTLYGSALPIVAPRRTRGKLEVPPGAWRRIGSRARSAPADIVPGLLGSTLARAGIPARATPDGPAVLAAVDRGGAVGLAARRCAAGGCPGMTVREATVAALRRIAAGLHGSDLLIALAPAPPPRNHELAIGIAGKGFAGELTSESTHTAGLVVTTDLAPTILGRLGVATPSAMDGQPITASGPADAGALSELDARLAAVPARRPMTIGDSMVIWAALAAICGLVFGARGLRIALPLLACTVAFLPAFLLLTAALEPSALAERLIVSLGAPAAAVLSVAVAGPWGGFAIAAAITVGGYAVDVVAGSRLTSLSLIGPNPANGARFYGIGNELEAVVAALVPIGVGTALTAWRPQIQPRAAAGAFAVVAAVAIVAFAPGRLGADVGAAIDLSVGAAVAALVCLGSARGGRAVLVVLAVPLVAFASLAAIDLATGGDSHLTRSVLQAGGLHDIGQIAERRLRLSADNFGGYASSPVLWAAVALIVAGLLGRRRLAGCFEEFRYAWAGFLGAAAAVVAAVLANDSGGIVLMIGTASLGLAAGVAWAAQTGRPASVT